MDCDEIRNAILQWRFLTACPLLIVAISCHAETLDITNVAEAKSTLPSWHYRDYLLYNALPSAASFSNYGPVAQISVGELLHNRNNIPNDNTRRLLLSAGFDNRADWESIRYGLGVFANLPESGQFHFNLYVRPNAQRAGYRWCLQPAGLPMASNTGQQNWSIGGFVDYARGHDGLHDRIGIAPQLILNLGSLLHMPGDAQASIQYAYWRSAMDNDAPQNLALQMALRWRF